MLVRSRPLWLAAALLLCTFATGRADLIFLKDGTVLQGKVKREEKFDIDPATKEPFRFASGFFLVDDGPRRMYFCQTQVAKVVTREEGTQEERLALPKEFTVPSRIPQILQVVESSPFDAKWDRKIRILTPYGTPTISQHLALLTPHYARVDAHSHYAWLAHYLTRELGQETVQGLVNSHPRCVDDPKLSDDERLARRFRACDFYAQVGWHDLADKNLDKMDVDFPKEKDKVAAARELLRKTRARDSLELIKRWHLAGRHEQVRQALAIFPVKEAADLTAAEFRTFKSTCEEAEAKYNDTQRLLDAVLADLKSAPEGLRDGLAAVRAELHRDRVGRLESFLGQALQAERQRKSGATPQSNAAQLASLAVTGWLLGSPSAEPRPEMAQRLWKSRQLVIDYLRSDDAGVREKMLSDYDKHKDDFIRLDEFAQIIPQLPPEAPAAKTTVDDMEFQVGDSRRGARYLVKLPPEYSHNRQYPVLMALSPFSEPARFMLRRYEDICAENGYILVVPLWEEKNSTGYGYSEREHQIALDTLRDVRRRFQVDSDRVFLTGVGGGGGDMAYDVGLSHPDLFAGVLPMASGPLYFSDAYMRNAQNLPFYVISGDRCGENNSRIRAQFNNWVPRGFNVLWVQYKGRGVEWFGGEQIPMFDWMRDKRRAFPMRQLGTDGLGSTLGNEYLSFRQTDNRFYWLSSDRLADNCNATVDNWSKRGNAARITARVDPSTNEIAVKLAGYKQLTIWLGRNAKGESMVDFDKGITVRVNLSALWSNRKATPSLEVLLKDLVERGDRQRLFLARIDLKL